MILVLLAVAIFRWGRAARRPAARKQGYLVAPYLDLTEPGARGSPYALGACGRGGGGRGERFDVGVAGIPAYDGAYTYPDYEGLAALSTRDDNRCTAYCQRSPCTIWCR